MIALLKVLALTLYLIDLNHQKISFKRSSFDIKFRLND